jgi:hypothetical protein
LLQRHKETGHIGELQLHTLDMLQARDLGIGIGGHVSAQEYHQQLLTLPAQAQDRSPSEQTRWDELWSQVRHLFVLALTAELNRRPHLERVSHF